VSRQIRHLEDYLGRALFVRDKRQLGLTQTGMDYYVNVQQSLQGLADATGDILQWRLNKQITVVTSNAMASLWLLPRLPQFQNLFPNIDVRILATDTLKGVRSSEYDIALFYHRKAPVGMSATPLFQERVYPICSTEFLQRHTVDTPEQLLATTQLWLDSSENWLTWKEWFKATDLKPITPDRRLNLNNYPMLIQAALNGQGIALGWEQLIEQYLETGLLVRPVATELNTEAHFYMLESEEQGRRKPGVEEFRAWLLEDVGAAPSDPEETPAVVGP
ncbi:MAG: LysR substrate-binding domain-containing protein, partial [Natronospirillum sp.]